MDDSIKEQLRKLEEKYRLLLCKARDSYINVGRHLKANPEVKRYIEYKEEQNKIHRGIAKLEEQLISLHQKHCDHNILCYANEYIDTYEIRRYIKCYCLDCGKLIEDRDYNFKDTKIIKTTLSYYVVQQLYSNFIKDYDTSDYEKIYCDFKNRIIDKEKEDKVYKFK